MLKYSSFGQVARVTGQGSRVGTGVAQGCLCGSGAQVQPPDSG